MPLPSLLALSRVQVWQRSINESFFFERSPTITMPQSAAIVKALKAMGVVDEDGNLMGDPRIDAPVRVCVSRCS